MPPWHAQWIFWRSGRYLTVQSRWVQTAENARSWPSEPMIRMPGLGAELEDHALVRLQRLEARGDDARGLVILLAAGS